MTSAPATTPPTTQSVLACPVCESAAPLERRTRDVHLHRCPVCDHCFTDVASLEYPGVYDEAWEALHPNWFANPNTALFALVAKTIDAHDPDAAVIDIGAGRGELLAYLRARSPRLALTGLDLALHPEIEGVEFVSADFNSVDLGERRWDVAVSLATIEHLEDVRGFAERLREIVASGGLAIVNTNNERSIPYDVARAMRKLGYEAPFERLYDRHHLNHFNVTSFRTLMERAGFRPLRLHRHNQPLASVDMPTNSRVLKLGVWGTFALGRLTGRTFFQTLVLQKR
jgi:SAM-dependent methyltransferase